jgi:hypothetical protein
LTVGWGVCIVCGQEKRVDHWKRHRCLIIYGIMLCGAGVYKDIIIWHRCCDDDCTRCCNFIDTCWFRSGQWIWDYMGESTGPTPQPPSSEINPAESASGCCSVVIEETLSVSHSVRPARPP